MLEFSSVSLNPRISSTAVFNSCVGEELSIINAICLPVVISVNFLKFISENLVLSADSNLSVFISPFKVIVVPPKSETSL